MQLRKTTQGALPSGGSTLNRRRLLTSTLMLAAAPSLLFANASAGPRPGIVGRWSTGNSTLYPFTLVDEHLYLSGNATVEAFDIDRGEKIWSHSLETPAVFRPRVTGSLVISAGRNQLTAWDRLRGSKSWSYTGDKELGVPLAHKGRIHLGEGHRLIALSAGSGEHLWSFDTDSRARIGYAPTGSGEVIFLGAGDGVLYALSCQDGKLQWKTDREKDWQYLRQLAVSGDMLVAGGYHDEIFGINKNNGDIRWRFDAGNFINSQLVTQEATYFWSPTGWVYALETTTGKIMWRHQTIDYHDINNKRNWAPIMAEMVVEGNRLHVLAMDHVLHVLNTQTGKEEERFQMPMPMRPFVVLHKGSNRVLMGSDSGEVIFLELA